MGLILGESQGRQGLQSFFAFNPKLTKYFFKDFVYLFLDRGDWREKERERNIDVMCERYTDRLPLAHPQLGTWPATQACALTENRTADPLVCRPALNPLSHTSHGYKMLIKIYLTGHFWRAVGD